jgi:hypothetical protein
MDEGNAKSIAIVLPVYKQYDALNLYERISLAQLYKVCSIYDIYIVTHEGINFKPYELDKINDMPVQCIFFSSNNFQSLNAYSRLLTDINFYKAFDEYDYILITQLDVFIFDDQLQMFASFGYDYIGAPWFENYGHATETNKLIGAGNGGFSLRKVDSFLRILDSLKGFEKPMILKNLIRFFISDPRSFLKAAKNLIAHSDNPEKCILPGKYSKFEDIYWATHVNTIFSWFKVASIEESIPFSFEVNPKVLYSMNQNKLPMAAHAWEKYNLEFWKPFIENYGYSLSKSEI